MEKTQDLPKDLGHHQRSVETTPQGLTCTLSLGPWLFAHPIDPQLASMQLQPRGPSVRVSFPGFTVATVETIYMLYRV